MVSRRGSDTSRDRCLMASDLGFRRSCGQSHPRSGFEHYPRLEPRRREASERNRSRWRLVRNIHRSALTLCGARASDGNISSSASSGRTSRSRQMLRTESVGAPNRRVARPRGNTSKPLQANRLVHSPFAF